MIIRFIFISVLACSVSGCKNSGSGSISDLDIYLLIGQSNMAGRADIEEQDLDTLQGVYLLTNDSLNIWEPAANPLNRYSTIRKKIEMQKLGPGYTFAKRMREYFPEKEIGLVVNARGGTSILEWVPGTDYYNEAVRRTKRALEYGTLKGIIWYQGSSDTNRTGIYLDSLIRMIKAFRMDFHTPDLPFVACKLSEDKPARIPFNEVLVKLPEKLEHTAVISAEGTVTFDSTHFNSAGQRLLGERFAGQMFEIINENSR